MLIAAIHGILTRQTDTSWPDHFDAWVRRRDPVARVIKKEYAAGPFPRWNCWRQNPRLARGLAAELALFRQGEAADEPLWLVAHSNGAQIALLTARQLVAAGRVTGVILTGAACEANTDRSGIGAWIFAGRLEWAIAYCSRADGVLPGPRSGNFGQQLLGRVWSVLAWPYGDLGRTGWVWPSGPSARCRVRWFDGGHSGYFAPGRRERTFELLWQDMHPQEVAP